MTDRGEEVTLRYQVRGETEIKKILINENDTPHSILLRLKAETNFHIADDGGHPFEMDDNLFGYCTFAANPPVKVLHGSALLSRKCRVRTPKKDNRIALEVRLGDDKTTFARGIQASYAKVLSDVKDYFSKPEPCHIACIRVEDDRIILECATGIDAPWFTEKACPPLKLADDKLYQEASSVGGWGVAPPSNPMQTRARAAAVRKVKLLEVFLHNFATNDLTKIGDADSYDKANAMAKDSGLVPKGWNVAVTEANDERIIVTCKKGAIMSGVGNASPVTPPKPKPKKTVVLPEKLVGKSPESTFAPRAPNPEVPGVLNALTEPQTFKTAIVRPIVPEVGSYRINCEILKGPTKGVIVRKDFYPTELFALTFHDTTFEDHDRIKIVLKPLKLEDGATYKIERISMLSRIALTVHSWDGCTRRCGIEVAGTATMAEIVREAQRRIDDEPFEEAKFYSMFHRDIIASPPWIQKEYDLKPNVPASGTVVVKGRFGEMTAAVPLLQPNRWQKIIYDSLPSPPLVVNQTGPREFRVIYEDEEVSYHVRFMTDDSGGEHLVSLLPLWENQHLRVERAFGRKMILDESRQSKDNILFVKSADGSPPGPTFERVMTCTLGDDSAEFSVRVHKGETTREVMDGLSRLHPGVQPAKIIFEGSEMHEADPVTEWATSTGTSPLKVRVALNAPIQRFYLWQPSGLKDLGDEELDGRSRDEIWGAIQLRNSEVKAPREYRLFSGSDEVTWENLPVPNLTLVPHNVPVGNRGSEFKIVDCLQVPHLREAGPLTQMSYQVFTMENTQVTKPIVITAPNEISLAQLVTYFILPSGMSLDVASVFYWNLLQIEDTSKADKTKRKLQEIPDKIPVGFNLRVKCSSLRENSTKRIVNCRFGDVFLPFSMPPDALLGRFKERVADWMNQRGQGPDWTVDGNDNEQIDFDFDYPVIPLAREAPIKIYLR
jgi:hypothetical protein